MKTRQLAFGRNSHMSGDSFGFQEDPVDNDFENLSISGDEEVENEWDDEEV